MKKLDILALSAALCLILSACGNTGGKNIVNQNTDSISSSSSVSTSDINNSSSSSTAGTGSNSSSDVVNKVGDANRPASSEADKPDTQFAKVNFGDTITTDFTEMTIDTAETAQELLPSDTSGVYSYIPDQDGETYFYLLGTIKNTAGDSYSVEDMNIVISFDNKYNYTGYIAADDGGNDFYGDYVKPFGSVKYYMYASVPDELINSYTTCTIRFGFHENFQHDYKTDFSVYEYCYEIDLTK